jgi:hypothetical protein
VNVKTVQREAVFAAPAGSRRCKVLRKRMKETKKSFPIPELFVLCLPTSLASVQLSAANYPAISSQSGLNPTQSGLILPNPTNGQKKL